MSSTSLSSLYADDHRTRALCQAWDAQQDCVLGACHGAFHSVLLAHLYTHCTETTTSTIPLIASHEPDVIADDLEALGIPVAILPELDAHDDDSETDIVLVGRRLAAMELCANGAIIIATPASLDQPVPALTDVAKASIQVSVGDTRDILELADALVDEGYVNATVAEKPGQIAVRGGLLDVFPWIGQHPIRIEFFDDEIDLIRRYDPFTQESIARIQTAQLTSQGGIAATSSIWKQLPEAPLITLSDIPLNRNLRKKHNRCEIRLARQLEGDAIDGATVAATRFQGDALKGFAEIREAARDHSIYILARNDEARSNLTEQTDLFDFPVQIITGRLSAGFRDMETAQVIVHDYELTHRKPNKRRLTKIAGGTPLSSLTDLKHNDFVVHLKHGIAKFCGMATLEKRGYLEDHLLLEFANDTKLYIPVAAIDLIQKYIGAGDSAPQLSKIGGVAWARKKAKAEKAVEDMTAELLLAHAQRVANGGIVFDVANNDYHHFEALFPYEETEDQLSSMRDIRNDMESPLAMDRLLCGDVGFGKTEVAMRAACKAALSGYQVAVLAPTTLLSEQHYQSFLNRFKHIESITVSCINRFRKPAHRKEIMRDTAHGDIDILIGTHALLSAQLKFDNLGLLIIDEEQRFGVKQKEHLKNLQTGVDVLTLSATPIPRTLHSSMLGIRNISVIAEAPAERLAVQTRVSPWDNAMIKTAVQKELDRGGQVFFVHNRVQDIDRISFKLSRLLPDMRIAVIHGQMNEADSYSIMSAYKRGEIDCLLATSIIESGIDIPNANTIFINNAHCFGLSELHQLRGRIGRFTRQAHAYFLTPVTKQLSPKARERLSAIQEYAELGSGFKLAMRDMEIRGAGNVLGPEQSGHIAAIGYELYCKLLNEAVIRAGGEGADTHVSPRGDATISFPIDAYIGDDYLDAPTLKFELHKHIDNCRRITDLQAVVQQTKDRYGPFTQSVRRLFLLKAVRLACASHGIRRIEFHNRQCHLFIGDTLPELDVSNNRDIVHIQPEENKVILFLKTICEADDRLDFCCRLFEVNTAVLQ